nr:hypothetical protein [Mesorhizobium sp. AR02]
MTTLRRTLPELRRQAARILLDQRGPFLQLRRQRNLGRERGRAQACGGAELLAGGETARRIAIDRGVVDVVEDDVVGRKCFPDSANQSRAALRLNFVQKIAVLGIPTRCDPQRAGSGHRLHVDVAIGDPARRRQETS